MSLLQGKKALLLDMNGTFMFGEDRFSEDEDYSRYYRSIGGGLPDASVNKIISRAYNFLDGCYRDESFRHDFPAVEQALKEKADVDLTEREIGHLVDTFSYHEHGGIPRSHVEMLRYLATRFKLALVIDIWSPKKRWLKTFEKLGLLQLFAAASFSSDHGMVKPSPRPFERVIEQLSVDKSACVVIGDSIRRDLGGALAAGVDCILVGGAHDARALACLPSLLQIA